MRILPCWVLVSILLLSSPAWADEPQRPQQQKKQDKPDLDAVLDGLEDELLERLEKKEAAGELEEIDEEAPPLVRIGDRMRVVQKRLARADTSEETIRLQEAIIKDLDELLKKMRSGQACSTCGKQNCQEHGQARSRRTSAAQQTASSQPSSDSQEAGQRTMPRGPDAKRRAELERMAKAIWGHLPPKVREQMEQAFSATLLPQYQVLIERYFRTLAEQGARRP